MTLVDQVNHYHMTLSGQFTKSYIVCHVTLFGHLTRSCIICHMTLDGHLTRLCIICHMTLVEHLTRSCITCHMTLVGHLTRSCIICRMTLVWHLTRSCIICHINLAGHLTRSHTFTWTGMKEAKQTSTHPAIIADNIDKATDVGYNTWPRPNGLVLLRTQNTHLYIMKLLHSSQMGGV